MATEGSALAMQNLRRTLVCLAVCMPTVALRQGGTNQTITTSSRDAF